MQLKRTNTENIYFDGQGKRYKEENDFFYPIAPNGALIKNLQINKNRVMILNKNSVSKAIKEASPAQQDKGIGVTNENEKVLRVLQNGDCSDGGSQQPDIFERQRTQLLNAINDGG